MKLYNDSQCVLERLQIADKFWSRARGLLFGKPLSKAEGLLITRCNSVHTCFMNYTIDVLYLDANGVVVKIVKGLRPWRFSAARRASTVIEVVPVTTIETIVKVGDQLRWV